MSASLRTLTRADYERFAPIVRRLALRLARNVPRHILLSDLISEGWLGLMEAFSRGEGLSESELLALAVCRIRGAMLDHLRQLDTASRASRAKAREMARVIAELTRVLGRQPEPAEVAAHLQISLDDHQRLLASLAQAAPVSHEPFDVDAAQVESAADRPDERALKQGVCVLVERSIGALPERHQRVLTLYYRDERTLREIGEILGVTESRVSQLHHEAIDRLRAAVASVPPPPAPARRVRVGRARQSGMVSIDGAHA